MNHPLNQPVLNCRNRFDELACSKSVCYSGLNQGFTLIEICIVIAIIATLSAIAIPNYLGYKNKARVMVAATDIKMLEQQISNYVIENGGQLPNNLSVLTTIGVINDPWGNPYQYLRIDGGAPNAPGKARRNMSDHPVNQDYDLYSMGKDGESKKSFKNSESRDDVVRAYSGQYVGLVSEL